jgi:hypothetical protein
MSRYACLVDIRKLLLHKHLGLAIVAVGSANVDLPHAAVLP